MNTIQVMVVDDHQLMRQGLRAILAMEDDIVVIGEAEDGNLLLSQIEQDLKPDVVLMDVQMPGMSGIMATRRLLDLLPDTRVIGLTAVEDEDVINRMFAAGASAYLLKSTAASTLVVTVREVYAGQKQTPRKPVMPGASPGSQSSRGVQKLSRLTRREEEVMNILMEGHSNKEIAQELVISERTVQTHLSNIFSKMAVSSRTEAVLVAMRDGWIQREVVN